MNEIITNRDNNEQLIINDGMIPAFIKYWPTCGCDCNSGNQSFTERNIIGTSMKAMMPNTAA